MNIGTAFITYPQTAEAVEPGHRTFDHAAPAAKSFPRFNTFARNSRFDRPPRRLFITRYAWRKLLGGLNHEDDFR